MKVWYYAKNGEIFGPYTTQELKEFADSGQIKADDLIWKEGMENWLAASQVKGLLKTTANTQQPPPIPPPVPQPSPINRVATKPTADAVVAHQNSGSRRDDFYPKDIDGLDVSENWKAIFKLLEKFYAAKKANGSSKIKAGLSIKEMLELARRRLLSFILGFLLGPIYYIAKGMWKKALVISFLLILFSLVCNQLAELIHFELSPHPLAGLGGAIFGSRASFDFYRKKVHGEEMWPILGFLNSTPIFLAVAVGVIFLLGATIAWLAPFDKAPKELLASGMTVPIGPGIYDSHLVRSVGEFVDGLKERLDANGEPMKVEGWSGDAPDYDLHIEAAGKEIVLSFTFDKPSNMSLVTSVDVDGQQVPPFLWVLTTIHGRPKVSNASASEQVTPQSLPAEVEASSTQIPAGTPIVKPSFDCSMASLPAEKAICKSEVLSTLDKESVALFHWIKTSGVGNPQFEKSHRDWRLAKRDVCGADEDCLWNSYSSRIKEMEAMAVAEISRGALGPPKLNGIELRGEFTDSWRHSGLWIMPINEQSVYFRINNYSGTSGRTGNIQGLAVRQGDVFALEYIDKFSDNAICRVELKFWHSASYVSFPSPEGNKRSDCGFGATSEPEGLFYQTKADQPTFDMFSDGSSINRLAKGASEAANKKVEESLLK